MNSRTNSFRNILKSILEYTVTVLFILVLMPVIVILGAIIKLTGEGPVIYSQKRIGREGKPFAIYKFRSMHSGNEEGISLITDRKDKRITAMGRFMRKYKFDEIPNFINVLKGEMSIIGPRPEQQFFIDQIVQIEPRYKKLQSIKPGITSWGQVKYGYASNVDEMVKRMEYDLFYLENRSLWFDLKIAMHTFAVVFKGKGV